MGEGKFKTVDKRAGAIVDEKGNVLDSIPKRAITSENLMDKIAQHFKETLEGTEITNVGAYKRMLEKEIGWAANLFAENAERFPEAGLEAPGKKQLAQMIAERAELLFIAERLEGRGLQKLCESLVSKVKDGKNVSATKYEEFLNKFLSGEEPIEKLLRSIPLSRAEKAGINVLLERGEAKDIIELGRQFNAVSGFNYPAAALREGALNYAAKLARTNLADLFGAGTWAWSLMRGNASESLGDHLARQYEHKHARFTRKVSFVNIGKVAIGAGVVIGIGYLFSQCSSCIFSGSEEKKIESRPSVRRSKWAPVTQVEKNLYANPNFKRGKRWKAIAKQLEASGLSNEEQLKAAQLMNGLPGQFIMGSMELTGAITLAGVLSRLSPGISRQKLANTIILIQNYVEPGHALEFAKHIAKKAKTADDIDALLENPPKGIKMSAEWTERSLPAFKGFLPSAELSSLCKKIRIASLKKGKEVIPLSKKERDGFAEALANMYSSGRKAEVPQTYNEDLNFFLNMRSRGFDLGSVSNILSTLRFVYKPEHLEAASGKILKKLSPSMGDEDIRIAVESVAFTNRQMASDTWFGSADGRLSFLLPEDAKTISMELRVHPQKYYEKMVGVMVDFANMWQEEIGAFPSSQFRDGIYPHVSSIIRSKTMGGFSPNEKSRVLLRLVSSVKLNSRVEALKSLEAALGAAGKKTDAGVGPTVEDAIEQIDAYLEENPKSAL